MFLAVPESVALAVYDVVGLTRHPIRKVVRPLGRGYRLCRLLWLRGARRPAEVLFRPGLDVILGLCWMQGRPDTRDDGDNDDERNDDAQRKLDGGFAFA